MTQHDIFMNRLVYAAIIGMAFIRLIAIGLTPLGLDVEEAQYWQWSTTPDAGYFTKPPMIAWIIGSGTALFGDTAFGIRFFAPIIQAISALLAMKIAQSVFNPMAGRIAGILWLTLPISALGGFVMSTDSPMLLFLMSAIFVLTPWVKNEKLTPLQCVLAGLFTGLAMMSKYAAIYLPAGVLIWWLWEGRKHALISMRDVFLYGFGMLVSMMPNLIWNLQNGFVTAKHLSHNANLDEARTSIIGSLEFLLTQLGIVGPIIAVFAVMVMIIRRKEPSARFWIALFIPAISVITVQGYFSDTNANWAVASWPPALILLSGYCAEEWRRLRRPLMIGISINAGIILVFLISVIVGSLGPLTPASDPLRRLRAWDNHADDIQRFADTHNVRNIVVFRRGYAAKLIWSLRDQNVSVHLVDRNGIAENHFEQRFAWSPKSGETSIFINGEETPPSFQDIAGTPTVQWSGVYTASSHTISKKRARRLGLHLGVVQ